VDGKRLAGLLAIAAAALPAAMSAWAKPREPIVLVAPAGRLVETQLAVERPGFSGTAYATGFETAGALVEFEVDSPGGVYAVTIRCALPGGKKGFDLIVNDERRPGMLQGGKEGWHESAAGLVALLPGRNRIAVGKGWGWWDFDRLTLTPAALPPFRKPPVRISDPAADPAAVALLGKLHRHYGEQALAGQMDAADIAYCRSITGKEPALGGFDLMDCSPSRVERGASGEGVVDEAIAWGKRGGVVMMMWHWNAPTDLADRPGQEWWRGFYTEATTFDLKAALADPGGERYRLLVRDLDAIATRLARLRDAGVPVLWRPLHEAQGEWFWWGAKGPGPFKALWRLMRERYLGVHGLHNLVWMYGPPSGGVDADDWYPGDDVVDVIGPSIYADPTSSMSGEWEALRARWGDKKLIGLAECGTPPEASQCTALGVRWAFWCVWSGESVRAIPADRLRAAYSDPRVITLDRFR